MLTFSWIKNKLSITIIEKYNYYTSLNQSDNNTLHIVSRSLTEQRSRRLGYMI